MISWQPSALSGRGVKRLLSYLFGTVVFVATFLARLALSPLLGHSVPYIFFFPGIAVSSWYGGLGSGLWTTALSAIGGLYLLRSQGGDVLKPAFSGWAVFVCIGTFMSWLNHAFRQAEYRATEELAARRQYEEALQKSEERLTLALDAGGGVGTWDWNIPSDRVYCNADFAKLFSVDPELAATGLPFATFLAGVHRDDSAAVADKVRRTVDECGAFEAEFRVVKDDGSVRWVHTRGRCHRGPDDRSTRFPGVVFDVTTRREAEDALRKANYELEQFAYVASHDLQEPLRVVNIYAQMIVQRLDAGDPTLNEYAGFVRQSVTRMQALIRDLLTFSSAVHTEALEAETADLSASFNAALLALKGQVEEVGAVIIAEPLPTVRGETSQMTHVFQNLLSNALKYRKAEVSPRIEITTLLENECWTVCVRDNGIGFNPQYAERIFGLFKRLHRNEYPGTGLGLAICRRIVERYGGKIWAEGRSGEGATFYFSLPPPNHSPREVAASEVSHPSRK
jgi:PAS domain S-box-containing protein